MPFCFVEVLTGVLPSLMYQCTAVSTLSVLFSPLHVLSAGDDHVTCLGPKNDILDRV